MNLDPLEKRKSVKKKLKKLEGLPTLPPIVQRLNLMIEDEKTSIHQIANLIEKDQVITSKILRLANSAFYGFPKKVSTVQNALMLLGINVVKVLILTSSIFEIIYKEDVGLWEHSIGVAACSRILAEKVGLKEPQEVATAGLLHDLGRIIQKVSFKEEYEKILELTKNGKDPLQAEKEILGIDHAEMGSFIMKTWNLPDRLVEAVDAHHEFEKAKEFKKEAAVVHLSDILIHVRGYGSSLYRKVPPLQEKALKTLKLNLFEIKDIFFKLEPRLYELKFFTEELKREMELNT
ncbi:metal dependent phosphohydrolase [Thermodesulfobacterium geofontis OPF15]|jgi:putative nucleotidyltransferase with HDIG domain|uniref:Metal dependent phosphohydrolase n=1 Tax=Thermodesulfobacterium geofontis (strain OPF15) TaxID=795359 RepID=F8C4L8_THEGP|nr:HDOD domain-containing protein [Thermodesulfobacterium geofontis]AEH22684.1 metal dependent phosphohydrolase [Thermodesulfobacterium geofontis OPF15]